MNFTWTPGIGTLVSLLAWKYFLPTEPFPLSLLSLSTRSQTTAELYPQSVLPLHKSTPTLLSRISPKASFGTTMISWLDKCDTLQTMMCFGSWQRGHSKVNHGRMERNLWYAAKEKRKTLENMVHVHVHIKTVNRKIHTRMLAVVSLFQSFRYEELSNPFMCYFVWIFQKQLFCVWMFCLNVRLGTTCIQYPRRPEESVRCPRTGVINSCRAGMVICNFGLLWCSGSLIHKRF